MLRISNTTGRLLKSAPHLKTLAARAASVGLVPLSPEDQKILDKFLAERKDPNIYYNGPERDHKNFPRPVRMEHIKPVRLGFIPDAWFQFFYKKTGVTGPYLFGIGLINCLFSKEIVVMDHNIHHGISWFALLYVLINHPRLGGKLSEFLDKKVDEEEASYENIRKDHIDKYKKFIENEKLLQEQSEAQKTIYEVKKENIKLQLEAEFRKRLHQLYSDVKQRLDYMVATENVKRQMEHSHMVNWIIDNAIKSITPQHEKEVLNKCFADLKTLAAKY